MFHTVLVISTFLVYTIYCASCTYTLRPYLLLEASENYCYYQQTHVLNSKTFLTLCSYSFSLQKFALQLKARLDNIHEIFIDPAMSDTRYYVKIKCTGCGEVFGQGTDNHWVYLDAEQHKTQNGQTANFVSKCKFCKREITIQILDKTLKGYKKSDDLPEPQFSESEWFIFF